MKALLPILYFLAAVLYTASAIIYVYNDKTLLAALNSSTATIWWLLFIFNVTNKP